MAVQRKIFISYRRADNPDFADRIRDWFIQRYGRENVFMDFDSIPPGVKFADHIRTSMQQSDAVIVIIGPRWVELFQERIAKGEPDFVRIELGLAIELEKPITPICVNNAEIPAKASLPSDLRPLLEFNFAFLDRTNFYERIERIIASVEVRLEETVQMKEEAIMESSLKRLTGMFAEPSAEDYYKRGQVYLQEENIGEAFKDFETAIRLNPNHIGAHSSLATIYEYYYHNDSAARYYNEEVQRLNSQN